MMHRILSRLHLYKSEGETPGRAPIPEPMRVEPGTFAAAGRLAAMAQRLDFGGNDAAAIRGGMVAPDLAEFVRAVDELRKPDTSQILRSLGDIQADCADKVKLYAGKDPDLSKRFERAALYTSNARTFYQAALMAEGTI